MGKFENHLALSTVNDFALKVTVFFLFWILKLHMDTGKIQEQQLSYTAFNANCKEAERV